MLKLKNITSLQKAKKRPKCGPAERLIIIIIKRKNLIKSYPRNKTQEGWVVRVGQKKVVREKLQFRGYIDVSSVVT